MLAKTSSVEYSRLYWILSKPKSVTCKWTSLWFL